MSEMVTFLINLDGSDDRLAAAAQSLSAQGIPFQRLPATDARGRDPKSFPEYDESRAIGFYGRPMTGGEIGCYLSHLRCAERFLASDATYALVLEDDMELAPNAGETLASLIAHLESGQCPDWEIVNLGRAAHKLWTKAAVIDGCQLVHANYFPVTTTGLLWSRAGARAFLDTRDEIYAPVDHFFRRFFGARGTGLALDPPIVQPSGAESEIDADGTGPGKARKRIPRTPLYFWREFRRQSVNYVNAARHMRRER